jgi:hypothetical protein
MAVFGEEGHGARLFPDDGQVGPDAGERGGQVRRNDEREREAS